VNHDLVEIGDLDDRDRELVRLLVREHEEKTASPRARTILVNWDEFMPLLRRVTPLGARPQAERIREDYLAEIQPFTARAAL
jgi:glutamate synthase domain-containing protein 3